MMKKILFVLLQILIFGCSKNNSSHNITNDIIGNYHSTDQTTNTTAADAIVDVSVINSNFIKISYNRAPYDTKSAFVFDSVKVSTDLTFTINQIFQWPVNNGASYISGRATGTGNFGTNTIHFKFLLTENSFSTNLEFNGTK